MCLQLNEDNLMMSLQFIVLIFVIKPYLPGEGNLVFGPLASKMNTYTGNNGRRISQAHSCKM